MEIPVPPEPPENRIVARYMPHASAEEIENARANLRQLARLLLRIEERLLREWSEQQIRESGDTALESGSGSSPLP